MPFSAYSNVASATTSSGGGGTPVAGAHIRIQSDLGVLNTSDNPAADGEAIGTWEEQETGVVISGWFSVGTPRPVYESGLGDLINGHPYVSKSAAQQNFRALVSDFSTGSRSIYALLDRAAGNADEVLVDFSNSGGTGNMILFLDRNGNVGYYSEGTPVEIAASTTGLQVLTWIFDAVAEEVRVYRNNVLLGTSAVFAVGGYDTGSGFAHFLADGAGNNDCNGKYLDIWIYPANHNTSDRTQQAQYLMDRGGI